VADLLKLQLYEQLEILVLEGANDAEIARLAKDIVKGAAKASETDGTKVRKCLELLI
jgi:hypothetical protein